MYDEKQLKILDEVVDARRKDFHTYVAQTSDHSLDFPIAKADLLYLWDEYGNQYLDFTSGIAVMNMGHHNTKIVGAIIDQLHQYSHTMVYGEHMQRLQIDYAKAISEKFWVPLDFPPQQVFFVNSGNESIDLALKMARKITGRKPMLALKNGFHGRGYGAMSVSWKDEYKQGFFVDDSTDFISPGHVFPAKEYEQYAGIILELVQGEAGCIPIDKAWVSMIVDSVRSVGGVVIIDEVQTGYGRTGTFLAQEQYGVAADITCLGKAGGGGLPFGAVVSSRENFEKLQTPALSHLSTFGGNPLVMAAGLAVLEQIDDMLLEHVQDVGHDLEDGINSLAQQFPETISGQQGLGLMRGLILADERLTEPFYSIARSKGLILHFKLNAGRVLRMSPPLVISQREIRRAVDILADVCLDMEGWDTP